MVQIRKDLDINIRDKDVLIIEDIMDSGQTLFYLKEMLGARAPRSLKICALLDKPERRVADIQPDYCGFEIPTSSWWATGWTLPKSTAIWNTLGC